MGTWAIIRSAWRVVRSNPGVVGIVTAFELVLVLMALPMGRLEGELTTPQVTARLGILLALCLIVPIIQGGGLAFAKEQTSGAAPTSGVGSFWAGAKRFYGRLLGLEALLAALPFASALILFIIFLVGASVVSSSAISRVALVVVALIPIGIGAYLLFLVYVMAPVVLVVDDAGLLRGVREGLRFVRARVVRLLLLAAALHLVLLPANAMVIGATALLPELRSQIAPGWVTAIVLLWSVAAALVSLMWKVALVEFYRRPAAHS